MLVIRQVRKSQKITIKKVSEKTGIARSNLSEMERGLGNPTVDTLERLARALQVQIGDLFAPIDYSEDRDSGTHRSH